MVLHIPHASQVIPAELREQLISTDEQLRSELIRMTDLYVDELFNLPYSCRIVFPVSRLLVDVERFPDDADEPMAKVGMGAIYTRTSDGLPLRRKMSSDERQRLIADYYEPHHCRLSEAVNREISTAGVALIVDCHSFPSVPLPCDLDQSQPRADFCVGTDEYHTPPALLDTALRSVRSRGFNVEVNRPYSGALVPFDFFRKSANVMSIMLEVNRRLYLGEKIGTKLPAFDELRFHITGILGDVARFQRGLGMVTHPTPPA